MTPTFDKGKAAGKREAMKRAELIRTLFELRYDMDCIGEHHDPEKELQNVSNEDLLRMIEEYSE